MAYSVIALSNLTELKTRRGTSTSTTLATILGLNYPMVEAYSVYWWDDTSTTTPDDNEIVAPIVGPTTGRWFKIELDQVPQVNADWTASSGVAVILNKPALATVASTGSYEDLIDTPFVPESQVQVDYDQTDSGAMDFIKNKPDLSVYYLTSNPAGYITGVTSGMITTALGYTPYNGTTNPLGFITTVTSGMITTALGYTPYNGTANPNGYISGITSAQIITALGYTPYDAVVNSAGFLTTINSSQVTTALGYIPVTSSRTITINGVTQDLTANRTWSVGDVLTTSSYPNPTWITSLAWSKITGTPTTLAGYGITDAVSTARTSISLTTTGTGAASYNNSTGVLNIPTPINSKRIETYTGTTDGSGNYTVTYGTAFSVTPDVQPQLQAGTASQVVRITSSTTTGFTVQVTNRASVNLLGIDVLLATTTPVSGSSVGVLVISR